MAMASAAWPPAVSHARSMAFTEPMLKHCCSDSQALLRPLSARQDQAMLDSRKKQQETQKQERTELKERLRTGFPPKESPVSDAKIATTCGVTPQAIVEWRKTGRIAKHHLPKLATLSGRSLNWWLGVEAADGTGQRSRGLSPRQELVLELWSYLNTEQEKEWLNELRAQKDSNVAVASHMKNKELPNGVPNRKVEVAFGTTPKHHGRRGQ